MKGIPLLRGNLAVFKKETRGVPSSRTRRGSLAVQKSEDRRSQPRLKLKSWLVRLTSANGAENRKNRDKKKKAKEAHPRRAVGPYAGVQEGRGAKQERSNDKYPRKGFPLKKEGN